MSKKHKLIGIFDDIVEYTNIYNAYHNAISGDEKYSRDALLFSENLYDNIDGLIYDLKYGFYEFLGYRRFTLYEPKERIIDAPYFTDKIVQLALNEVLKKYYNNKFISDSYSCIENKGTHRAALKIHEYLNSALLKYGEGAYIIKIDIRKFFYSINRKILKKIIKKYIYCKRTLDLFFQIIDSADIISEKGLPLGNTMSQLSSNIYMNEVDQYAKRKMGLEFYVRYADDMVIVVESKPRAMEVLYYIKEFLINELDLQVNEKKTDYFPINQGVNTVGFKIYPTHLLLRDKSKRKIKDRLNSIPKLIIEKGMEINKAEQMINSWKGHANHADSWNFYQSLINRYPFLYLEISPKTNKERFYIDPWKLKVFYDNQ